MGPLVNLLDIFQGRSANLIRVLEVAFGKPSCLAGCRSWLRAFCCSLSCPPPGVRLHFHNLVKGLTDLSACKAQLGLGHSYSRAKVKFNVNRVDNMIIQSISLLDQLDKDINTFSMRVR